MISMFHGTCLNWSLYKQVTFLRVPRFTGEWEWEKVWSVYSIIYILDDLYQSIIFSSYRDAAEVKDVREKRDPIKLLTGYALDGNLVQEEELKVMLLSQKIRGC